MAVTFISAPTLKRKFDALQLEMRKVKKENDVMKKRT